MIMIRTLLALALLWPAVSWRTESWQTGRLHRMHDEATLDQEFDRSLSRSYDAVNFSAHGITKIALERSEPSGGGLAYVAVLTADGSLRFTGFRHPERVGFYRAKIAPWEFNALAQYVLAIGFEEREHTYTSSAFDRSSVFTSIVRDGQRTLIRNDARAGPPELWALEQLIEGVLQKARWTRTGDLEENSR